MYQYQQYVCHVGKQRLGVGEDPTKKGSRWNSNELIVEHSLVCLKKSVVSCKYSLLFGCSSSVVFVYWAAAATAVAGAAAVAMA